MHNSLTTYLNQSKMNYINFLLISIFLFSCGQTAEQRERNPLSENIEDLIEDEPESVDLDAEVEIIDPKILIPSVYRDELGKDLSQLDDTWKELYFNENKNRWFVDKASFEITRDFDHCAGDSVTIVLSARKAILFFKDMKTPLEEIQAVIPSYETMFPERQLDFTFSSGEYTLSSSGKVKIWGEDYFSSEQIAEIKEDDFRDYHIDNYSLNLKKKDSQSQEIIRFSELAFTCPLLLWIGDLDQDGKPDFIFDTPDESRTRNVELYLSSQAEGNNHIKKVADVFTSNDC